MLAVVNLCNIRVNMGRILQGIGAGSGLALSRSVMRDIFSGSKLAKLGSYLSIANIAIILETSVGSRFLA